MPVCHTVCGKSAISKMWAILQLSSVLVLHNNIQREHGIYLCVPHHSIDYIFFAISKGENTNIGSETKKPMRRLFMAFSANGLGASNSENFLKSGGDPVLAASAF